MMQHNRETANAQPKRYQSGKEDEEEKEAPKHIIFLFGNMIEFMNEFFGHLAVISRRKITKKYFGH